MNFSLGDGRQDRITCIALSCTVPTTYFCISYLTQNLSSLIDVWLTGKFVYRIFTDFCIIIRGKAHSVFSQLFPLTVCRTQMTNLVELYVPRASSSGLSNLSPTRDSSLSCELQSETKCTAVPLNKGKMTKKNLDN